MTDTPRTDDVMVQDCASESESYLNMRNHARQLERELAQCMAERDALKKKNDELLYAIADQDDECIALIKERDELRHELHQANGVGQALERVTIKLTAERDALKVLLRATRTNEHRITWCACSVCESLRNRIDAAIDAARGSE